MSIHSSEDDNFLPWYHLSLSNKNPTLKRFNGRTRIILLLFQIISSGAYSSVYEYPFSPTKDSLKIIDKDYYSHHYFFIMLAYNTDIVKITKNIFYSLNHFLLTLKKAPCWNFVHLYYIMMMVSGLKGPTMMHLYTLALLYTDLEIMSRRFLS